MPMFLLLTVMIGPFCDLEAKEPTPPPSEASWSTCHRLVHLAAQGRTVVKTYDRLPARVELENSELGSGKGFMEAQVPIEGKTWGAQEALIKAHSDD